MPSSADPGCGARCQPFGRAPTDDKRRQGDQDDLDQRDQSLGFAVAEAVVAVGRQGGNPHPGERDEAGDEVEPGVGKAAEHRHRSGFHRRPGLEAEEEQGRGDAGERGAGRQSGAKGLRVAESGHG